MRGLRGSVHADFFNQSFEVAWSSQCNISLDRLGFTTKSVTDLLGQASGTPSSSSNILQ